MKMLNLGCGHRFHSDWVNLDFRSTGNDVIAHNLLKGIPFKDGSFDVVYHSHVLEHFSRDDAFDFINECSRVLKSNGIIRVVVPDLEMIARCYLESLEKAIVNDNPNAHNNYEWIKLELYDQTVRNHSGGQMADYLKRDNIPNLDFVYERVGQEAKDIHTRFKNKKESQKSKIGVIYRNFINALKNTLKPYKLYEIGRFRLGGEIHQWMYDRYSLSQILVSNGFRDVKIETGSGSRIIDWDKYNFLDLDDSGNLRKPDSLIIEAIKK